MAERLCKRRYISARPLRLSPSASVYGCILVTTSAARQTSGGPGTTGMESWLDDSDRNFGPDLPLPFKLYEIWSVDSQENH